MNVNFEPDRFPSLPPRPKPFHMTDAALQNGLWSFWLTADEPILQYVSNLNCVLSFTGSPFLRRPGGRVMVSINPRYDHLEAWNWIYNTLEGETQIVDLGETWEQAIDWACQSEDEI
ncbi:MAG: hypothetical protein ABI970_05045 [Chloroflexota bacterium]|nr:hypothetical protein [Anaerolineae bacterium]